MTTNLKSILVAATVFGTAGFLVACGDDEKAEAPAMEQGQMEEMATPEAEAEGGSMMEEMGAAMEEAAEDMGEAMDEAAEDMGEAMEEGYDDMGEAMDESSDDMEEAAEEMADDMEDEMPAE